MALAREEFGRRMRAARERAHLSQQEVADQLGVDWRQIQRYDAGKAVPRASRIPKLAAILGVEAEHLQEPQNEHAIDRIERKAEENARALRTALGLLDEVVARLDQFSARAAERYDMLAALTTQVSGRLEALETRQDTAEVQLTRFQEEFLHALGATVPPPRAGQSEPANSSRSKRTRGTRPATG